MDESADLGNFELMLKKNTARKPSALYNSYRCVNNTTIKPQDVLNSVNTQIKMMQLADGKSCKNVSKNLKVKSDFMTVSKLPVYSEVPQQTNTFETQCVSDTQLMNIIDDAEALIDTHKGITQEFNTAFTHTDINYRNVSIHDKTERDNMIETQEFDTTFTQTNVDNTVSLLHDRVERDDNRTLSDNDYFDGESIRESAFKNVGTLKEICNKIVKENNFSAKMVYGDQRQENLEYKSSHDNYKYLNDMMNTKSNTENIMIADRKANITIKENEMNREEDVEIDSNKEILNNVMEIEEERSPSPVFNIKTESRKGNLPSPLIVSLESFEKFERLAIPLIDSNDDIDTSKHLINSQILGGELCLNTSDVKFNENGRLSPILEKHNEFVQEYSKDMIERAKDIAARLDLREKRSDSLKDEILFSSDDENDFIFNDFGDIPLTAALETSFYDHSNVLEETMYVGFQTASNKSIQISADSFKKAQFILAEDAKNDDTDYSFTKLVDICDEKSFNKSNTDDVKAKLNPKPKAEESVLNVNSDRTQKPNNDVEIDKVFKSKIITDKDYDNTIKKPPEKQGFIGFKTASNKGIVLSDKAIELGKTMMMEIKNGYLDAQENTKVMSKNNAESDKHVPQVDNIDDLIIQEFENIEMSLEEKEKKCDKNKVDPFMGFKTARNQNINVSHAAQVKIKNVFQDIDLKDINECDFFDSANKDDTEILPRQLSKETGKKDLEATFVGFKTANNKNIRISAQALAKTKAIFEDEKDVYKTGFVDYDNHPSTSKMDLVGFKTANNKNINISETALSKSSRIFNDIDKEHIKVADTPEPKSIFKSFKRTSSRSMKIFENFEKNEELKNRKDESLSFKTANDKSVVVSKESVARSKQIFEELDGMSKIHENQLYKHVPKSQSKNKPIFKGFQTASKKPVSVSLQALERSNKIFKDIDDKVCIESNSKVKGLQNVFEEIEATKEVVNADKKDEVDMKANSLFKTASNKNVEISEKALAKCKRIFDNIDDSIEIVKKRETFGFQTANNKKVALSEEALKNTKDIFKDIEIPDIEPIFKGFQTASNKKVEISKEAIEKTKEMFSNIESEEPQFMGFQTGRNKKVDVSKDALEKTKTLFDDTGVPEISFKGFQTASKKSVQISETALAKCKGIFQGINDDGRKMNNIYENKMKVTEEKVLSFQTANKDKDVYEDSNKSKVLLKDSIHKTHNHNINLNKKDLGLPDDLDMINTEVINDFETSISEDLKTPRKSKRSSSPILSCPRAKKKKKFETPYKEKNYQIEQISKPMEVNKTTKVKFNENYKKNKKYKLNNLPKRIDNIDPYITSFNLDNILNFEFNTERNEITNDKMTLSQLKEIFLSAVNKNLIPEGWLDIHIKLILWKLLSYEIKYNYICSVQDVMEQLKFRYDKELYNTERSVLRKIYEKDDVAAKTMVLCVAGINIDGVSVHSVANNKEIELLLTDGWYFIKATIDKMLLQLVCDGKIFVGCKIVTSGAELVNCEGMAPWEDTSSVRLKISGNSTRPARWDTKLGYTAAAILSQLSSVKVDGGKISRLSVYVARVYPLLYVEKFEDGSTVTRSERLEHLHQMKYESERELIMERIYEEVQREFSDQESQNSELFDSGKRRYYDSGSQIAKMMKHSNDPMEFRAQLTSSQVQLLQDHTCKHRERLCQAIQNRIQAKMAVRNVVTLARVRIASVSDDGVVTKGMLSVWKPNDAVLDIIKEGSWIEIMNSVPTAIRYSEIQITAGRQSVFRASKNKTEISRHLLQLKRTCYKISDVTQNPTKTTDYNEIDTVGIVFQIDPSNKEFELNKNFQNVYLADVDKNIISVNFWGGIKKFGFENVLDTGQIVACANLQKRAGNTRKNIPQFRVTELTHFTKTPKNVQAREMVDDMNQKLFGLDRRKFCDDCIAIKNNYAALRCLNDSENESPYRYCKGDYSLARNKMFIDTPLGVKPNRIEDVNLNLTGLDFESTFKQDTQELSPKTLMRKKKVNEKIAKLKMYGEPPPLSPITIIDRSANAKKSYKSPLANTPIIPKNVAIVNKLPEESPKTRDTREKSPVFSVKRPFVSVPVKLNFANESKNELVDHFADEFDGSPPLSLD